MAGAHVNRWGFEDLDGLIVFVARYRDQLLSHRAAWTIWCDRSTPYEEWLLAGNRVRRLELTLTSGSAGIEAAAKAVGLKGPVAVAPLPSGPTPPGRLEASYGVWPWEALLSKAIELHSELTRPRSVAEMMGEGIVASQPSARADGTIDVALSFAGEQRQYVRKVAESLRRRGARIFYDEYEEVGLWGANLHERLNEVYSNSRFVVMFVSAAYKAKLWPTHERRSAFAGEMRGRTTVLPVRFDETEIPGLNSDIAYVSAHSKSPADLAALIMKRLAQSE